MKVVRFWVHEYRKRGSFVWLFEDDAETPEDITRVAERIDAVARTAYFFEPETPLSDHERELIAKLLREVKTEKSKILLTEMLV